MSSYSETAENKHEITLKYAMFQYSTYRYSCELERKEPSGELLCFCDYKRKQELS